MTDNILYFPTKNEPARPKNSYEELEEEIAKRATEIKEHAERLSKLFVDRQIQAGIVLVPSKLVEKTACALRVIESRWFVRSFFKNSLSDRLNVYHYMSYHVLVMSYEMFRADKEYLEQLADKNLICVMSDKKNPGLKNSMFIDLSQGSSR